MSRGAVLFDAASLVCRASPQFSSYLRVLAFESFAGSAGAGADAGRLGVVGSEAAAVGGEAPKAYREHRSMARLVMGASK